jgi:hypothetical protein
MPGFAADAVAEGDVDLGEHGGISAWVEEVHSA